MAHLGYPAAAAAVAAPILKEWVDMIITSCGFTRLRAVMKLFLVRYLPSENWKRGPVILGHGCRYLFMAFTGQMVVPLAERRMTIPWRKGSVSEDFNVGSTLEWKTFRSWKHRSTAGSNDRTSLVVYSDTLKNPKNLSSYKRGEKGRCYLGMFWFGEPVT